MANSGVVVPNVMTVRPIMNSLTPKIVAMSVAEPTASSVPSTRTIRPTMTNAALFNGGSVSGRAASNSCRTSLLGRQHIRERTMRTMRATKMSTSITPSILEMIPSAAMMAVTIRAANMNTASLRISSNFTSRGAAIAHAPRMYVELAMLAPNTLPTEMEPAPPAPDTMASVSSGAEVPMPTMVRPITRGLTP